MENDTNNPKFHLGQVVMTVGISATIGGRPDGYRWLTECLARHLVGDWGDTDPSDQLLNERSANDLAIDEGDRVMSTYVVPGEIANDDDHDDRVWVITCTEAWEADTAIRATTILWPSEY